MYIVCTIGYLFRIFQGEFSRVSLAFVVYYNLIFNQYINTCIPNLILTSPANLIFKQLKMQGETSIEVAVRVKPPQSSHLMINQQNSIVCGSKAFTFDYIFSAESTQNQIYSKIGTKLITNVKKGYNSCVFAYGQTGSGKTYTMTGDAESNGLIQACMNALWSILQCYQNFEIKLSYYEIYNQQINDLLLDKKKAKYPIKLKQSLALGFYLQNITEVQIQSCDEMISQLYKGLKNRSIGQTKMNSVSSRSHSILTLKVITREKSLNKVKSSKVHFVDLAGSEKQKSTAADGQRLKQASKINRSLTLLSLVIEKLAKESTHIPYRDSILTKILKDSLGGNSKTILLAAVSSNSQFFTETLSTLNFAAKAKNIKLNARVNEEIDEKNILNLQRIIKGLQQEIKSLKQKQTGCENCENNQKEFEALEIKFGKMQEQYKVIVEQFQKLSQYAQNEITLLNTEVELKDIENADLKMKINMAEQNCKQFFESFVQKLKKAKFTDFQKQLLVMQMKKIKQLQTSLAEDQKKYQKKDIVFRRTIQKLQSKLNSEEPIQKQTQNQSQLSQNSEELLNMKNLQYKYESELQSLSIIRQTQIQKIQKLQTQNNYLKEALEETNATIEFMKDSYDKKLKQEENLHKQQILRLRQTQFRKLEKNETDYYEIINQMKRESRQKQTTLNLTKQWAQKQESALKQEKQRKKIIQEKLQNERKDLEQEKKEISMKDKRLKNAITKFGRILKIDISNDHFNTVVDKITNKIQEFQKLEKQLKKEKPINNDYFY